MSPIEFSIHRSFTDQQQAETQPIRDLDHLEEQLRLSLTPGLACDRWLTFIDPDNGEATTFFLPKVGVRQTEKE